MQDLTEVLEGLEMLRRQGIVFGNAASSGTSRKSTTSGSRKQPSSSSNRRRVRAQPDSDGDNHGTSSSSSSRCEARAAGRNRSGSSSSTSSPTGGRKRVDRHAKADWRASVHSKKYHGKTGMRFDELSADALYELMNDGNDARAAKAARRWVQDGLAAKHLHPSVAARLEFLLATDYIAEEEGVPQWPQDWVFGEMFNPDSERSKGRARAGSAYDYVRYDSSDDEDDGDDEDDIYQVEVSAFAGGSSTGWLDIEELFAAASEWDFEADDSDSDDSDNDIDRLFF